LTATVTRMEKHNQDLTLKLQQLSKLYTESTYHLAQKVTFVQHLLKNREQSLLLREPPNPLHISVLIPIYNGQEYFSECLSSILEQNQNPHEILIGVNGHASDSDVVATIEAEVAQQQTRTKVPIRIFTYETPSKVNTLHQLITIMSGTHVALLDVDDTWLPEKLEKQVQILNRYHIDVIGTHCEYFGTRTDAPELPSGFLDNSTFFSNPIINSSAVIRRELAFWDESNTGVEDYELWLRLAAEGRVFYNVAEKLVHHRIHDQSAFNTHSYVDKIQEMKQRNGITV